VHLGVGFCPKKSLWDTLKAHTIITCPNENGNIKDAIKGQIEAGKESGSDIHATARDIRYHQFRLDTIDGCGLNRSGRVLKKGLVVGKAL
jgi:hypothetical protein